MNETAWVKRVAVVIERDCLPGKRYEVQTRARLPYGYEIRSYDVDGPVAEDISYETDLLIIERTGDSDWVPRVVIEAKINSISTHDAITYSQKANTHKRVHPYLRYGVILGNRRTYPLPGRLFRHGAHFDFMLSFKGFQVSPPERVMLRRLLQAELKASQTMQHIMYESRQRSRKRFTLLHRRLVLE